MTSLLVAQSRRGRQIRRVAYCISWLMPMFVLFALPVVAEDSVVDAAAPEVEVVYDPYRGVDENGRIPRIDKAALIARPERWRYVPEGRIKPGGFFERFLVSSFLIPLFFANSDVGIGLGLALTDIDFRAQRRREFMGAFLSYTTEGQQSYVLRWRRWLKHLEVPTGGILQEERSFASVSGGYRKTLTRRFFGIGPSTQERQETSYTDQMAFLDLDLSTSLEGSLEDFVLELGLRGEHHWLGRGRVGSAGQTDTEFPRLFTEADPYGLGWLAAGIRWDTRDSQRNPYRGTVLGARVDAALLQNDWKRGAIYRLFGDQLIPVPGLFHDGGGEDEEHPPTDTIAIHLESQLSSGDLPFFARPTLGGNRVLRGYIQGRWHDNAAWEAATEYRVWVIQRGFKVWRHIRVERVGLAVFYEAGAVANDGFSLFRERVRHSYGVSGRFTMERAAIFRADFGFSEEGLNFSAGFGLPF
ncbi:MAG: BamA/TamA family outer membrane protein [Nitrospirota bacterium]|nr:BamA/TamA family outer membrane protein [Nitrospirota bacterium]